MHKFIKKLLFLNALPILAITGSTFCFSKMIYAQVPVDKIQAPPLVSEIKKTPPETLQDFEMSSRCKESTLCIQVFSDLKKIEAKSQLQARSEYLVSLQNLFQGYEAKYLAGSTEKENIDVLSFASGLQSIFEYAKQDQFKKLASESAQCQKQKNAITLKIKNYFLDAVYGKTYFIDSKAWEMFEFLLAPICNLK